MPKREMNDPQNRFTIQQLLVATAGAGVATASTIAGVAIRGEWPWVGPLVATIGMAIGFLCVQPLVATFVRAWFVPAFTRAWWMPHWPSWVVLVALSVSFMALNAAESARLNSSLSGWLWEAGYPFTAVEVRGRHGKLHFGADAIRSWDSACLFANFIICAGVTLLSVCAVEVQFRRNCVSVAIRVLFIALAVGGFLGTVLANILQ